MEQILGSMSNLRASLAQTFVQLREREKPEALVFLDKDNFDFEVNINMCMCCCFLKKIAIIFRYLSVLIQSCMFFQFTRHTLEVALQLYCNLQEFEFILCHNSELAIVKVSMPFICMHFSKMLLPTQSCLILVINPMR